MRSKITLATAASLLGLVVAIAINHHWMFPDFRLVPGDRGDTRLVVFVLEHWFSVLKGNESFYQLGMFYPDPLALGYADGLFLFALPYIAFRLLGADYFLSYQLLCITLTTVGYFAWLSVLRRLLRTRLAFGILGAILLASMNSLQVHAQIGKLLGFNLYPLLILLLHGFVTANRRSPIKARIYLACFAALLGLFLFTSYYPAWYFLFTMLLLLVALGIVALIRNGTTGTMQAGRQYLRSNWKSGSLGLAAFLIALIPFAHTYAPLISSNAKRSFALALEFAPTVRDLINVSAQNYVWGPLLTQLDFKFGSVEVQTGSPMLVLLLSALVATQLLVAQIRQPRRATRTDRCMLVLAATGAVIAAMTLKVHESSLWHAVYSLVPGAAAMRATGRYLMVFDMIVIITAIFGLDQAYGKWRERAPRSGGRSSIAAFALVGVALIAEQVNGTAYRLDRQQETAWLSRFQAPTAACAAFYMDHFSGPSEPVGYYHLDAMMVGMNLGLPTVNGYSGVAPDAAFRLAPNTAEYKYRILRWLDLQGKTSGICELDATTGQFRPVDVDTELSQALKDYQSDLVRAVAELHAGAKSLQATEGSPDNFYPRYLEEHGYLDAQFGYGSEARFRWMQDRYWIGTRKCSEGICYAIGVLGSFFELRPIVDAFGSRAQEVYFPVPDAFDPARVYAPNTSGELLMVFSPSSLER